MRCRGNGFCGHLPMFSVAAAVLIFIAPIASAADSPNTMRVLRVSAATDNYPYSYLDDSGKLTGYGVDMLDAVAEVMNVRLERTQVPAKEDISNLKSEEFDIFQFHAPLAEGSPIVAFSQPILVNMGDVFVRKNDTRFASIDDLRKTGGRVAVAQGGQEYLLARGFDPSNLQLSTSTEAILALSKGEVDAVLLTRLTGLTQAHHSKVKNVRPLGLVMSDFKITYSIATRIDNTELLQQVNEALAYLSTTGDTVEIYSRWFGRYEAKGLSLGEILAPSAAVLAVALIVTLILLRRQHRLRSRITAQAEELRISREILAEAQHFAHLGHFQYPASLETPAVWSEEAFHIFGFNPDGGVPDPEQMLALAVPSDQERWRKALALDGGASPYEFDIMINTLSGQRKILNVLGHPMLDASGVQNGTFGTVQDVTASRTASAALKQSELLLRGLFENLPVGLSVLEYQGNNWCILSVNPETVRQFNAETSPDPGTPITEIGLPTELTRFWCEQFDHAIRSRETLQFEYESDPSHKYYSSVVPLLLPEQSPRCCFLSKDITEQRLKEQELSQSRRLRAIGELVGGIAHEFNNLITPITLNAEILLGQCDEKSTLRNDLELIIDAGRRAGELTRKLLAFGRRTDQKPGPVDLSEVVDTNIALVQHTFDRRITIKSSIHGDLPLLILPRSDLQQIVLNLLLNARDSLEEKLEKTPSSANWNAQINISITTYPSKSDGPDSGLRDHVKTWARLTVSDNGCGIPLEVRERMFEPFFTTKAAGKGTGLGLATIWHLVTEFGGRIDVHSVPNEGTAFHLDFPIYSELTADETAAEKDTDKPQPSSAPPQNLHFLLAEDDPSVAQVVRRLIENMGHKATVKEDGLKAIEALRESPEAFDAVIMDLNMPKLTGAEATAQARALPYERPIIVMSGRIGEEDRKVLLSFGVTEMLSKPFSRAEFESVLTRLFGSK
ncbi:MAG: transporter substrate-binding domain-containing protein [Pontiellaceae bacterium]|nr:transporter substrate-binding domain-containing protein [Pontiellaceae bacterium]